ncbi:hypothetical protein BN14_06688 [Rhizoctonia solani AG-1 IB]|uniref:Uncharacterized protein n=1 Tax=Thanatephorus cucumeris (strain AG1-IB / isolate 7/3/14) TaxID=1108050 RepID=M5C0Z0_THACB|nr:hypothetical protein BN14_06688 [Rhizoctonia solani AG-1 IB]
MQQRANLTQLWTKPDALWILDAEVAAILLAVHLISVIQEDTVVDNASIYSDSQAAIACINSCAEGASHELLRATQRAIQVVKKRSGRTAINLKCCPGHLGVPGNKEANAEASRAASGHYYPPQPVPQFLSNFRPATNPTTRKQVIKIENTSPAKRFWALSKAGAKFVANFPGISPCHFLAHARNPARSRVTLLYRLITGHFQLRKHLFRLQLVDSSQCEHCGLEPESVTYYLFRCSHYAPQRQIHLGPRGLDYLRLSHVLHATATLDPLFDYIKSTGRYADTVNPKSADFSHAKTRPLYADVWQNLALICGFFWHRFTPGANSLLETAAKVRMTGKIRMNSRTIRTFGVHRGT